MSGYIPGIISGGGPVLRAPASAGTEGQLLAQSTTSEQLEFVARPSGAPDASIQDQRSSGVSAGNNTSGSWATRVLNTIVLNKETVISLLSSNQFTVVNDGWVEFYSVSADTGESQLRLYCVTDTAAVAYGICTDVEYINGSISTCGGPVEAGKTYRVEQHFERVRTNGLGRACGAGTEVYTRLLYWKEL